MDRKKITKLLTDTLISDRLSDRKYYATEVTLDYGTAHPKRVDIMQFIPAGVTYTSDIEKGTFTCYEIKSCPEDVFSGHGLRFYGEKNYIVTTAETYRKVWLDGKNVKLANYLRENYPESSKYFGFIILVPAECLIDDGDIIEGGKSVTDKVYDEIMNPTPLDKDVRWRTHVVFPCHAGYRNRSTAELLFCMLRSGI